jgi:hypothetical protein
VNYWVDLAIGVSFVFSAISGLVFVLPGDLAVGILGISYQAWNNVHTWSSLTLIVGVGAHLTLHWKWMVSMTRRMLSPAECQKAPKTVPEPAYGEAFTSPAHLAPEPAHVGAKGTPMSRRTFLAAVGTMATAAGLLVVGAAIFDTDLAKAGSTEQEGTSATEASSTEREGKVACPRGLVNDPYPGKCHHYVDTTGDGFCDYSVPG